jgi:hypothetical protein
MSIVQIEVYNTFRALGFGEKRALKAASLYRTRRDLAAFQANMRLFKYLLGGALAATGLLAIYA